MDILSLVCIALSVAADAFVTSVCDGMAYRPSVKKRIAVALSFGIAQAAMPVLGAILGKQLIILTKAGNYISFAALFIVGVIMFFDGFGSGEKCKDRFGAKTIALQAFATSVDAFACGVSLSTLTLPLWLDGTVIGTTTFVLCLFGVCFATTIGKRFSKPQRFKTVGGFILIALAMKNLIFCFA